MLTLYWSCFLIGGVFVILAVVSGLDGIEFELEFDSDVELFDPQDHPSASPFAKRKRRRRLPILRLITSLKFWTFGTCFFGLTGILLRTLPTGIPAFGITLIALGMGLLCGTAISGILLYLRQQKADSLISHDDLMGLAGTVEIPFDAHTRGKVRLKLKGSILEVVAFTDSDHAFQPGAQVVVVGTQDHRVWVVSKDAFHQLPDTLGRGKP